VPTHDDELAIVYRVANPSPRKTNGFRVNATSMSSSDSLVCETDINACALIAAEPMLIALEDLFNSFKSEPENCYTLGELVQAFGIEFNSEEGAKQSLALKLQSIATRISKSDLVDTFPGMLLAGISDEEACGGKEEFTEVFDRLSPITASKFICPDIWLKTHRGQLLKNIPVLLLKIVSGSEEPTRQALLQSACNTVDLLRLYTNVFDSDAKVKEVSSIVVPRSGAKGISSAVRVTARWGDVDDWRFQVSFKAIRINDVMTECESIMSTQYKFITEQTIDLRFKYLVRLYDLPPTLKQIPSKHSIVLLDTSNSKKRILKFTPRICEREWLSTLFVVKDLSTAVKPMDRIVMNNLDLFTYEAVVPPLPRSRLLKCFRGFVIETAKALRVLHGAGIAHLDVRIFNVGFRIVESSTAASAPGASAPAAVQAVLIDLDRGTRRLDGPVFFSSAKGAQYARPQSWPADVVFNATRCDWRQWALMVWSLLVPALAEGDIYSGKTDSETCPFLFLRSFLCEPDVEADEDVLIERILNWVDSVEVQQTRISQKGLDVSDLATEVRLSDVGGGG
jgi:hypothetical protein